ncbi:MAG TPA: hypothetical protein VI791_02560, partial [Patescibacteria group bacterium]|nr:hypothetical protein [Patescibacteria group bacterium]
RQKAIPNNYPIIVSISLSLQRRILPLDEDMPIAAKSFHKEKKTMLSKGSRSARFRLPLQ